MKFVINQKAVSKWVGGKQFLVANMTLIVPGVLNGSQGPLFYPPEEIRKNYKDWNNIPLTLNHPTINNQPVSAKTQGVEHLGMVRNPKYDDALKGEAWFSPQDVERIHKPLLVALLHGDPVEISTGLHVDREPFDGVHNGKRYTHIARNFKPDHLAILPDQEGACSLREGCGLFPSKTRG